MREWRKQQLLTLSQISECNVENEGLVGDFVVLNIGTPDRVIADCSHTLHSSSMFPVIIPTSQLYYLNYMR